MTIVNGYRMESAGKSFYRAVESVEQAEHVAQTQTGWTGYTLTPQRYVKRPYGGWVFIEEDNLVGTLYQLFTNCPHITITDNWYASSRDTFESQAESGKNYLMGREYDIKKFLKRFASSASDWQAIAHEWAVANPDKEMVIETTGRGRRFIWVIRKRGAAVEFGLPHHDSGGEKHYIFRLDNPRRKLLVNVD